MLVDTIRTGEKLRNKFEAYGRYNQFSIDGYNAIVDYFEEIGKNIELDVIGICCNFKELTPDNLMYDYSTYGKDIEEIAEKLSYETWIIELKNGNYLLQIF